MLVLSGFRSTEFSQVAEQTVARVSVGFDNVISNFTMRTFNKYSTLSFERFKFLELSYSIRLRTFNRRLAAFVVSAGLLAGSACAKQNPSINSLKPELEPVNVFNYVEAKTAIQFDKYLAMAGGAVNTFSHRRSLVGVDAKSSKRLNRDTLYSIAIVDISKGATLTLPDSGNRYISAQVVNQHGFTNNVLYGGGEHELSLEEFDTPFVWILVRTLVFENIIGDLDVAHSLQDKMTIRSASKQSYTHVDYEPTSLAKTTKLLVELGSGISSNAGAAGKKGEVDPVMQLLTAAYGFGTLPETESLLINVQPKLSADQAYSLTVKNVPVDGFWSLAVYNKDGYYEKNKYASYGVNDRTAKTNVDGSIIIHFGGDPSNSNFIPITDGWNYVVRLYQPRKELLDGSWQLPELVQLDGVMK